MTLFGDIFHILRIFLYPLSSHEKCYLHIVFGENIHQNLGVLVAPCGIKGERDLFFVSFDTVDRELSVTDQVITVDFTVAGEDIS